MKTFILLISISAGLLFADNLKAENFWEATNGPYGFTPLCFAEDSSGGILCGTDGMGIFRSIDGGKSWNQLNDKISGLGLYVKSIEVNINGDIYIRLMGDLGPGKLYTSSDLGKSWIAIDLGDKNWNTKSIAINKLGYIFCGTYGFGLFRSTDFGNSWQRLTNGIDTGRSSRFYSITIKENGDIYSGTYSKTKSGNYCLIKSIDNGESWFQLNIDSMNFQPTLLKNNNKGEILYSNNYNDYGPYSLIIKIDSTDKNWKIIFDEFSNGIIIYSFMIDKNDNIFVCTNNGNYKSTDDGNTWELLQMNIITDTKKYFDCIYQLKNSNYVGGLGTNGIFLSSDIHYWEMSNNGITKLDILSIFDINSNIYCYGNGDIDRKYYYINKNMKKEQNEVLDISPYRKFFNTTDNGDSWELVTNQFVWYKLIKKILTPKQLILINFWENYNSISLDTGKYWKNINYKFDSSKVTSLILNKYSQLFAITYRGNIFRSTDYGNSWSKCSSGLKSDTIFTLAVNNDNQLFAGTSGGLYTSIDNGNSWRLINNSYKKFKFIFSRRELLFAGNSNKAGLYRSEDKGKNWTAINNGLDTATVSSIDAGSTGDIFAITRYNGIYRSSDNGNSWFPQNDGIEGRTIYCTAFGNNGYIYAGTDDGVYKSKKPSFKPANLFITSDSKELNVMDWNDSLVFNISVLNDNHIPVSYPYIYIKDEVLATSIKLKADALGKINYKVKIPESMADSTYSISFLSSKDGYEDSNILTLQIQLKHQPSSLILSCNMPDTIVLDWLDSAKYEITILDNKNNPVNGASVRIQDSLQKSNMTLTSDYSGNIIYTAIVPNKKQNGTYQIIFSAQKSGYNNSDTIIKYIEVKHIVNSIHDFQKSDLITISPNPVNSSLKIRFFLVVNSKVEINLFDIYGNSLLKKEFDVDSGLNEFDLNIENYPAGVYLLKINSTGNTFFKKIIKN